jgi:CHAD domain-containing protein
MTRVRPADSASKATRTVVRAELDSAISAAGRLPNFEDLEALHDCRVALRRLRVQLKAYAILLEPGVPKDLRRAVKALAGHTGPARDAEVFLTWLTRHASRLPAASRQKAAWLIGKLTTRRDAAYRRLRRIIPKGLAMIEPLLRVGLSVRGAPPVPGTKEPSFVQFTARCVAEQIEELTAALDKIRGPDDEAKAHRARIATKKLRYLLEPALTDRGRGMLKPLKAVQDALGEFHDLGGVKVQVAMARRWRDGTSTGGPSPRLLAALARIEAVAERQRLALFRRIRREILGGGRRWLLAVTRWARRNAAIPAASAS